jgi:hypothetical protein
MESTAAAVRSSAAIRAAGLRSGTTGIARVECTAHSHADPGWGVAAQIASPTRRNGPLMFSCSATVDGHGLAVASSTVLSI